MAGRTVVVLLSAAILSLFQFWWAAAYLQAYDDEAPVYYYDDDLGYNSTYPYLNDFDDDTSSHKTWMARDPDTPMPTAHATARSTASSVSTGGLGSGSTGDNSGGSNSGWDGSIDSEKCVVDGVCPNPQTNAQTLPLVGHSLDGAGQGGSAGDNEYVAYYDEYLDDPGHQPSGEGAAKQRSDGMTDDRNLWQRGGALQGGDGEFSSSSGNEASMGDSDLYEYGMERDDVHPLYAYDTCEYISEQHHTINGTSDCALWVHGADAHADLLSGGVDGLYSITGCFDGKPLYVREGSPPGEDRALSYNMYHGGWELSIGDTPSEDQLVMYSEYGYLAPTDAKRWHLAVAFSRAESLLLVSEDDDVYFVADGITVSCAAQEENSSCSAGIGAQDAGVGVQDVQANQYDEF